MKRFWKNVRGGVTVLVTIMLVPIVIISGTFVDLARAYASRSLLENATQMGANSAIAEYNNLLKDMYGVFGYLQEEDSEKLNSLIQEYVIASLFGNEKTGDGETITTGVTVDSKTFSLLLGDKSTIQVNVKGLKNLRDRGVIRDQISEYMKYRGPVVVVTKFLELLDQLGPGGANKEIGANVKALPDIESEENNPYNEVNKLLKTCAELYEEINRLDNERKGLADDYRSGAVYNGLKNLQTKFQEVRELEEKYQEHLKSKPTDANPEDEAYQEYQKEKKKIIQEFNEKIDDAAFVFDNQVVSFRDYYISEIDKLIATYEKSDNDYLKKAKEIETFKAIIDGKLKRLEKVLEQHQDASQSLKDYYKDYIKNTRKLIQDIDNPIELYGGYKDEAIDFLKDLKSRFEEYKVYQEVYLDDNGGTKEEKIAIELSLDQKEKDTILSWKRSEDADEGGGTPSSSSSFPEHLGKKDNVMKRPSFPTFSRPLIKYPDVTDSKQVRRAEFYKKMKEIADGASGYEAIQLDKQAGKKSEGKNFKEKQRGVIGDFLREVSKVYEGCFKNTYAGAQIGILGDGTPPAANENIGDPDQAKDLVNQSITKPNVDASSSGASILDLFDFNKLVKRLTDKVLLLTYDTTMFSNYLTDKSDEEAEGKTKTPTLSLTGVEMNVANNYFYQAEWEYLYKGNSNADKNLTSVTQTLFVLRILYNTALSFVHPEVNQIVTAITAVVPFGLILGPIARAAFVLGESAIDVSILRNGGKLPLVKTKDDWKLSPSGALKMLGEYAEGKIKGKDGSEEEKGLGYTEYLLLMLVLLVDIDTLEGRTADLIELNVNNYKNIEANLDKSARQAKMLTLKNTANHLQLQSFDTAVEVESGAEMRMMFLSLPITESFVKKTGIPMPIQSLPMKVKVLRSY